ncbi:hypothetical protein B0H13DRAFT_2411755 [Mycena leptocephala]|nr:hypothetical protein B0H13DRAFT_2411755 [Mycena leptocephala]
MPSNSACTTSTPAATTSNSAVNGSKISDYRPEELPNPRMITPWLLRNGWAEHLHPYREHDEELRELASLPSEEEFPILQEVVAAYFWKATKLIKKTHEVVLQRLNSADPDKNGINNTPLHAFHQEDQTFAKYILIIVRLIASLLREPEHYHLPVSQQLKGAVEAVLASFEDPTNTEEHCSQLHLLLLALWRTQWEATENHLIHDPTMCFLALFSLEKTGEFAGPKKTTNPIAKLCWGIKLCMLKEIHELVKSGQCKDQLEAFKMIAPFVIEHELTTFHHLRSLTHYATTLAYATMEAPNIIWTDRETWREMLYLGEKISLEQLQKVLGKLEEEIAELWEDRIMLNTRLHVKYGDLSDNLANTNPGYSFITNPLNPFAAHRNSFVEAMQKKPDLAGYFVYEASGVEELQLNMDYSRKWLCDLAELEGLVMLYTELTPGALIRWTELASLQMQNTQYRLRNALGVGKFVALVRQYDKTSNTAQRDRFIPHAASGFVADLLIQLHTFARPFAQVFPGEPDIVGMYGDLLFMNFGKQFTTEKLSALMAQWTSPVLGWSMTVQPLRQINTAFRRKHCRSAVDEEEDDDDTLAAVLQIYQAGHGKAVDVMHYGRTHNPLLGITDEVMFAFLQGSVSWQQVLEVVPGGLALPYYYATMKYFARVMRDSKQKPKLKKISEVDPSVMQLLADLVKSQEAMAKSQEAMLAQMKRMEHSGPAPLPWSQQLSHLLAPVPVPVTTTRLSPIPTPAQSEDSPMDDITHRRLIELAMMEVY